MQEIESAPVENEPRLVSNDRHDQRSHLLRSNNILPASPSRRLAPLNSNCIVCGRENANGLQLNFVTESKGVHATWIPKETWESFRGTVHGGIITAVLDEAMSKAIVARGWEAFTVELKVRFHLRVCPGERLHVEGWVREKRKRRILAEASLAGPAGQERAHAWATFLVPPGERS
jgi:acyl-coenzyme A thioesterase PaaI-like protein